MGSACVAVPHLQHGESTELGGAPVWKRRTWLSPTLLFEFCLPCTYNLRCDFFAVDIYTLETMLEVQVENSSRCVLGGLTVLCRGRSCD